MNTIKNLTKYVFLIALIGILAVTLGCPTEYDLPISVTGITVTGANEAIVVTNGQTLQMSADVLPEDATDQTITWSVAAGTGTATISATGLLTATGVGTVTVKATANDESAIEGTLVVTVTAPDVAVSIMAIPGVTAPVRGATPDLAITETDEYTGTVAWAPVDSPYADSTVYTATITLAAKAGYIFTGVAANSFTVAGATATNAINSGVVTAVFPATEAAPDVAVSIMAIPGVTAPARGATPDLAITETAQYTGTVAWAPADSPYEASTVYTATITLTAKTGYTLTGVAANSFTVAGATATNAINSGVISAVFPATDAAPDTVVSIAAVPGVTAPARGATPDLAITETAQYTGTVAWAPVASPYAASTVYTATITLTAKTGYTFIGVAADSFTVAGATTTNAVNTGVVTAVFPATEVAPDVAVSIAAIPGVTAPARGATPDLAITETAQYTGTVAWTPADSPYEALTVYTATITLTAKTGYTFTGVAADSFTVAGATATNTINSGVVSAVFPATEAAPDVAVSIMEIPGVTAPARGATPDLTVTETDQYTGTVAWAPVASPYAASTVYTATITLTAKTGYTFAGVAANSFTVAGATATNTVNTGVVTAVFPATEAAPDVAVSIAAIPGVTAPVRNVTPDLAITDTDQYSGTITWAPADSPYAASTVYTATITLTAKTGYTFTGVAADSFTVAGATATNAINSGVVTAVFPATEAAPDVAVSISVIPGVTAPARGATPDLDVTETDQYTGTVAWAPVDSPYAASTVYTATITLTAKTGYTLTGVAANFFTVDGATATNIVDSGVVSAIFPATSAAPLAAVDLGTAADFAILAETLISTTGTTHVTGDLGISPAATAAFTGFALVNDATNTFATSSVVTGSLYAANMADPTPAKLTAAVSAMEAAYTNAAGRTNPDELNLAGGAIGGLTLEPGLYKWGTAVGIADNLTLSGGADDIWIFQIAGDLNMASNFDVLLTGGAVAENVFWQVAGIATLGTGFHMEGTILSQTQIILMTGSSINGRLLAQTQVTLDAATVVEPVTP